MTIVRVKLPFASRGEMREKHAKELAACEFVLRTSTPREKGTQFRLELRLKDDSHCFSAVVAVEDVETAPGGAARMRLRILEGDEAVIDLIDELGGRSPARLKPAAVPLPDPGSAARSSSAPPGARAKPAAAKPAARIPPPPIADPFEDLDIGEDDAGAEALRTGAISVLTPVQRPSHDDDGAEAALSADDGVDPFAGDVPAGESSAAAEAPGDGGAANDAFGDEGSVDPFAASEPAADPFARSEPAADPFAEGETAADPFAAPEAASDPFGAAASSAAVEPPPAAAPKQAPPARPIPKPQPVGRLQPGPKPQPASGQSTPAQNRPAAGPQTGAKPHPSSGPQGGPKPQVAAKPQPAQKEPPAPAPSPRAAPPRAPAPAAQSKAPHAPPSTRPPPPPMAPPVIDPSAAPKAKAAAQPLEARSVPMDIKPAIKTPAGKGAIIGIDLGTTNSCAAVVKHHKPFIIPSREGYNTIPSVVALTDKGKLIVGHPAKSQMLINPRSTVYGSKRLVGRQFNSPVVTDLLGRFAYEIVSGERGEAAVRLGDDVLTLQQISALIIGEVKDIAQQWLGTAVTRAVITVPAYYNDNQRQAVRAAGALAGLNVERILNEPTAAAIAFAHGRELEKRILVYDLGGGTFDASVLELHGSVYEVVSTGGDTFLGGVDFDKAIVQHLLDHFKGKHRIEFPGDRVALQRIADAAERAKIGLSEGAMAAINVPFVALVGEKPYDLKVTLVRDELDRLTGPLVDRTLRVCDDVLTARGLGPGDIAEVILVGGMSRMPLVRQKIREFFGKEPSKSVHPDEAVALGAAMLAESIDSGDISGLTLIDVLPMSIGVGLPGGRFKKIIERNTSLPHKRSYSLWTSRDDQTTLEIPIFQGESDRAEKNEYLGTLLVPDLPRGARGTVVFDIQFVLSAESILTVTAEQRGTARTVSATFSTQETPDGIRRRLQENPNGLDSSDVEKKAGKGGFFKKLFGGNARTG